MLMRRAPNFGLIFRPVARGQVTPSFLSATDKKAHDYATQIASQSQLPDARRNIFDVLETTEFQVTSMRQN